MHIPDAMSELPIPSAAYAASGVAAAMFLYSLFSTSSLRHIPTVGGPSAPVLSYIGAFRTFFHGKDVVLEGYRKFKGSVFKMALFDRWMVVVCGTKLVEELHRMPDEDASFLDGTGEVFATKYMFGDRVFADPYHGQIIREQLTRSLGVLFDGINEEIVQSFDHFIPAKDGEWTAVDAYNATRDIVAQTSARVLSGFPLCRNQEYLAVQTELTMHMVKGEAFLGIVPPVLKPLIAKIFTNFRYYERRAQKFLQPVIEDRLEHLRDNPDWPDKPNDFLQWLIEGALAQGKPLEDLAALLLSANFVAIDTSSNTFMHALYHLAARPEYAAPLREEAEAVIEESGWTKSSLTKMKKLDSFFRETIRYNVLEHVSIMRKAMKDITLSTGTTIPSGTIIAAAAISAHLDDENYADAYVFDPFRFSNMREDNPAASIKYQMTATSVEYLGFGHGKHACPGRFFAANEIKMMMVHLLLNYDVKLEQEGIRPADRSIFIMNLPDWSTKVLFRKRAGSL